MAMAAGKKPKQATYGLPTYTMDNLVAAINEAFGVGIVKSDLTNPEPAKVLEIYALFLEYFGILDLKQAQQPVGAYTLSHNSAGVDEMEQMIVYSNVYSAIKALDIHGLDITFTDFMFPNSKRVQAVLSHLVNFYRFCKMREVETESIMEICNGIAQKKFRFQTEAPIIERQINDIYSDIFIKRQECEQKSKMIDELHAKCVSSIAIKSRLQNEIKSLKAKQSEVERDCEQKEKLIEELKQSIKTCEEQIAESPEKLNEIIEEVSKVSSKFKAESSRALKKIEAMRNGIANVSMWANEISSIKTLMKSVEKQNNDVKNNEERIKNVEGERLLEEIADAEAQYKKGCDKESTMKEQIKTNHHKHQLETASLGASLEEAKRSLEKLKLSNSEKDDECRKCLEEIENLSAIIAKRRDEWQEFEYQAEEHSDQLNEKVDKFYSGVVHQIQTLSDSYVGFEKLMDILVS